MISSCHHLSPVGGDHHRLRIVAVVRHRLKIVFRCHHHHPSLPHEHRRSRVTGDPSHRNRQRAVIIRHASAAPQNPQHGAAAPSSSRNRKSSSPAQSRHRIVSVPHHYFSRYRLIVVQGNPG
jgi:hypothetical protein